MARTISHSFASLTREILFLPLEHKIHIFSPPCNILCLLYRHECFTGKYTTRKIHKNYIRDPSGLFSIISLVSLLLRPLNFNYSFFKALVTFCHCRALFSSVLWLKIIVSNVLYCCTLNLSRNNYFLANKNLLLYRCLSRGKNNILLTRSARS